METLDFKKEYFNLRKELNSQSKNLFNKTNDNYILKISNNFSKKHQRKNFIIYECNV
jgi:hypothetical protein